MKSARRFAIVALLTIAGSLLFFVTEARHPIEEYPIRHRHRHHRHEIQTSLNSITPKNYNYQEFAMKPLYFNDENNKNIKETYDIFNDNTFKKHKNHKIINYDDDDDDDDEEEEENDEIYNDDDNENDDIEYRNDRYYPKRKNLRFKSARYLVRGHKTRLDSRLHHVNNYQSRNHDFITNNPELIKDDIDIDYPEYPTQLSSSSLSHWPQYRQQLTQQFKQQRNQRQNNQHHNHNHHHHHHHHHPRRQQQQQQLNYNRDNELYFSSTRQKNYHSKKIDFKNNKYYTTLRKKLKHKSIINNNNNNNLNNINNNSNNENMTKNIDRKWRNIKWNEKFDNNKNNDDDEEEEEEEEENSWLDGLGDYDDDDDDDDEDDNDTNDFEKTNNQYQSKPPYKTYDEIIKRLTSNEPTNQQQIKQSLSIKRDSRNIEAENFLKRDSYGNFVHDSINNNSNNNNNNNKSINLNNKNISIIISQAEKKSRSINNNQSSQNDDDKKLNSIIKLQGVTKSLDREIKDEEDDVIDDDDDEEKETIDEDEEENLTDGKNDTLTTTIVYTVNDNETETSVPITTALETPSTTIKTIEKFKSTTASSSILKTTTRTIINTTRKPTINSPVIQKINNYQDYQKNNTMTNGLQLSAPRASSIKLQTKDVKIQPSESKKNAAEYKDKARQNAIKVSREGSCQWPRARVIPVRDVYPNPSTTYVPHCAILHRCSDDTGCCRNEALTCVPKHSHPVELYFYTTSVDGRSVVEKLSFYNDTECECREKSDYGLQNEKEQIAILNGNEQRHTNNNNNQHQITLPPQNIRIPIQKKPCRCPSEFTPRITANGDCQCNCFENDENCINVRKGKGFFSLQDRLCIQNKECALPSCEFGEYIKRLGTCPKKKDKFESIANFPNTNYPPKKKI